MNLTLSVPAETADKAKKLASGEGQSLSAWFRAKVESETEARRMEEIGALDSKTAGLIGIALPIQEHWDDPRWRALAEKHLR